MTTNNSTREGPRQKSGALLLASLLIIAATAILYFSDTFDDELISLNRQLRVAKTPARALQTERPLNTPLARWRKKNVDRQQIIFAPNTFNDPKSVALREQAALHQQEQAEGRAQLFAESPVNHEASFHADPAIAEVAQGTTTTHFIVHEGIGEGLQSDTALHEIFMPNDVLITVVNPKPDCKYSVTIVSQNKYTGTATLYEEQKTGPEIHQLQYSWKPVFPGEYQVLVHEVHALDGPERHRTPLIEPGRYPIFIKEGLATGAGLAQLEERIQDMPPCQTMRNKHVYSHWDGDWLGPDFRLDNSLRTGWSFLPSRDAMNCKIETFTPEMIQSIPTKKKIYILGRSVERGVFFSLVDLMLNTKEKEYLSRSTIGTCWGRALVSKGNLEVSGAQYCC